MQSHNPFGQPAAPTVDVLLGKSYHVVKTVYLNLPLLKEINSNAAIKFIAENFESIVLIEQNLDVLNNLSENMDILKDIPKIQKEIDQQKIDSLKAISAAAQNEIKNLASVQETIKATLNSYTNNLLATLENEANLAMFSFRYCNQALSSANTYDVSIFQPVSHIKVGDHVIDKNGDIYQITKIEETSVTIGSRLTSIRGEKGLPGTGLNLLGVFDTYADLIATKPIGKDGEAYSVTDTKEVYVWDINKHSWQNAGSLKGAKGDPGLSANEILMSPDPEKYFLQIYGQAAGDIIDNLEIIQPVVSPDPSNTFENVIA